MSYDATIIINMDAVDQICNDLKFGEKSIQCVLQDSYY